jgi:hypothetical protein
MFGIVDSNQRGRGKKEDQKIRRRERGDERRAGEKVKSSKRIEGRKGVFLCSRPPLPF